MSSSASFTITCQRCDQLVGLSAMARHARRHGVDDDFDPESVVFVIELPHATYEAQCIGMEASKIRPVPSKVGE